MVLLWFRDFSEDSKLRNLILHLIISQKMINPNILIVFTKWWLFRFLPLEAEGAGGTNERNLCYVTCLILSDSPDVFQLCLSMSALLSCGRCGTGQVLPEQDQSVEGPVGEHQRICLHSIWTCRLSPKTSAALVWWCFPYCGHWDTPFPHWDWWESGWESAEQHTCH